ncbi:hypothetical protein [Pseudoxanthomonas taiwanensis]|uniref:hypothetical protein n=1 Tax=Pseudoxanthomonas taiwanensis TaxID=176598 RepID=UPI001389C124|nr:hypothetical protein [Pseudoxanthomonas taiwanensis]
MHRKPSPAIEQVPGHPGRIRVRDATAPAIRRGTLLLAAVAAGCVATPREPSAAAAAAGPRTQQEAAALARPAAREPDPSIRTRLWLDCASAAHAALDGEVALPDAGIALADHCSTRALLDLFRRHPGGWQPGRRRIAGRELELRIEGASPMARGAYTITPAQDVPVPPGWDFRQPGFGLPLVLRADRCTDAPDCALYTPEGIYRWATAWIEHGDDVPVVRIVDPVATPSTTVGGRGMRLSFDAFSSYWKGAMASRLPRLGVYGLLGGDGIGRRAGAYLLTDYDPRKTPVVMVHGVGSHPIIWAELSGAIWADPVLRDSYQVIHVVFQTNAPLLVSRQRVRTYLDRMWELLDPEGDDPARGKMCWSATAWVEWSRACSRSTADGCCGMRRSPSPPGSSTGRRRTWRRSRTSSCSIRIRRSARWSCSPLRTRAARPHRASPGDWPGRWWPAAHRRSRRSRR